VVTILATLDEHEVSDKSVFGTSNGEGNVIWIDDPCVIWINVVNVIVILVVALTVFKSWLNKLSSADILFGVTLLIFIEYVSLFNYDKLLLAKDKVLALYIFK